MIVRDVFIGVLLTQKEHEFLCKKAEEDKETRCRNGKKNLSAYIRKCVLQESGYQPRVERELKNLTYQVRKIGVNVNQAVKKINSGYYSRDVCEELLINLEEINQKFSEFSELLEEEHGSD